MKSGLVVIDTEAQAAKLEVNGIIKVGDQPNAVPSAAMMRYNTTLDKFQGYVNDADNVTAGNQPGWVNLH